MILGPLVVRTMIAGDPNAAPHRETKSIDPPQKRPKTQRAPSDFRDVLEPYTK